MIDLSTQTVPVDSPDADPSWPEKISGPSRMLSARHTPIPRDALADIEAPDAAYGIVKLIGQLPKDSGHI
jgi:hypothetical protein